MAVRRYDDFKRFCTEFEIKHLENGVFYGDDWNHNDLKAPYSRLYIILDGEGMVTTDQGIINLKNGYAYIIPANMNFSCRSPKYLKKLYLHFSAEIIYGESVFDECSHILEMKVELDPFIKSLDHLQEENISAYYYIKGIYTHLIYSFIGKIDNRVWLNNEVLLTPKVKAIHQFLKVNLTAKIRINDIALQMNMSQSALSKFYKEATGVTLKSYIQQNLMQKAQLLLLTSTKSIQEIAYELGYDDALYFTRVFSKWNCQSPTKYRLKNRII